MRTPRTSLFHRSAGRLALALAALLTVVPTAQSAASAAPARAAGAATRWAPAGEATITPGVQMYTAGGQCTGNFVFTDRRRRVYVGYAAHCAGTGEATDTDGCQAGSLPLGTPVRFARAGSAAAEGTTVGAGRLAYSSWLTMRRLGTTDADACAYNDFALVRVGRAHLRKVNPTVPFWGGPVGLRRGRLAEGETVHSFGSSSLRGGVELLSPKQGTSLGTSGGGWSHTVLTLSPGVPGDSGSGFLDGQGRAVGTLSTLTIAPLAGSNGVGDLHRELAFARRHSGVPGLRLVRGTEEFAPVLTVRH